MTVYIRLTMGLVPLSMSRVWCVVSVLRAVLGGVLVLVAVASCRTRGRRRPLMVRLLSVIRYMFLGHRLVSWLVIVAVRVDPLIFLGLMTAMGRLDCIWLMIVVTLVL